MRTSLRKYGIYCAVWGLTAAAGVWTGCSRNDADLPESFAPAIGFEAVLAQPWSDAQEGAETKPAETCTGIVAFQGESGSDSLFLHTWLQDGIDSQRVDADQGETRAAPVTTMHPVFGVWAYAYAGTWSESLVPNLIDGGQVRQSGGVWRTAESYLWPGAGKNVRFFAYAPYGQNGLTASAANGTPKLTYTVPTAVAQQTDVLAATATCAGDRNAAAELRFGHVLTAVRFVAGDAMMAGRITKITLKGVYGSGSYAIGGTTWSGYGAKKDFSQTLDLGTDGTPDAVLTAPAATFMMLPQTLPAGATVEVAFTDSLTMTPRTLTASIAGAVWPVGKTVTYRISTTSIVVTPTLKVTGTADYTYAGGNNNYTVASYASVTRTGDPTKIVPLAWKAEFSTDEGKTWTTAKPDWLTAFTVSGAGSVSDAGQQFVATVSAQTGTTDNPHNKALKETPSVNTTYTPYNLSNSTGAPTVENTANCYVVNAPGKYSLPLVYGNAIRNKATNKSYTTSSIMAFMLLDFVNHLGNGITDPYIYNNSGCFPNDACLVWQDEKDLVTNIALSSDKRSLTFEVSQATIKQGNAIVAVRDTRKILWSWHIWVTDYKLGENLETVTNGQGERYTFLPVSLGWCDGGVTSYAARNVQVRITQIETGSTRTFTVHQLPQEGAREPGNCPYYQWGRKDPMLPGVWKERNTLVNKTEFDDGYMFTDDVQGTYPIEFAICYPHMFLVNDTGNGNWCETAYNNLWNLTNASSKPNDNPVIKTVYDPSPVGYCVPSANAWTGFTFNAQAVTGVDAFGPLVNSPYTDIEDFKMNLGWYFYRNPMKGEGIYDTAGGTVFFPMTGYRDPSSGRVTGDISPGYYWSSQASNSGLNSYGYFLHTGIESVNPLSYTARSSGFAVRPMREK